jgi:hypothetical protein
LVNVLSFFNTKPLSFEDTFVYVRDTTLLAPAGMKTLKSLGNLYQKDGDFTKREVSYEDISQMSKFLKRDPKAFIEYAIHDAKITVKHETEMEKLNKVLEKLVFLSHYPL